MLLQKNLSRKISPEKSLDFLSQKISPATGVMVRKISPEKSLDFWSRKSVLRPA